MFKVKDRVIIKSYSLEKGFVLGEIVSIAKHPTMYKIEIDNLGEIVSIAKHPTMYKIEIDNPTDPHRYEWVFKKELLHIITICA